VSSQLGNLIAAHGYWIVAAAIAVEAWAFRRPEKPPSSRLRSSPARRTA
jgi:hypothetical protein